MGSSLHLHDAYTVPHAPSTFEVLGTEASALATAAMSQPPDGDVILRRTGHADVLVDVGERENLYDRGLRAFAAAVAWRRPAAVHGRGRRAVAGGRPGRAGVAGDGLPSCRTGAMSRGQSQPWRWKKIPSTTATSSMNPTIAVKPHGASMPGMPTTFIP